jgi:hypothetical protein
MSSRESKEQGSSGRRGSESEGVEGSGGQPRQGSGRVERQGESEPKHHFEPGSSPSEQGEKEHRSPEVIARRQQGTAGAGTGQGGGSGTERSEEVAQGGDPGGEHTRHGRQGLTGDR